MIPCANCGTPFDPVGSQGRRRDNCSRPCSTRSRWVAAGYDTPEVIASRFWAKVDKNGPVVVPELGECWLWTSTTVPGGYGQFWLDGRNRAAHQVALTLESGERAAAGLFACHRCDNPPCVRPSHIFLGTAAQNNADMASKGRARNQWTGPLVAA